MNIGIIGYCSMGKMLLEKFSETGNKLFISNRNPKKISHLKGVQLCSENSRLAESSDIIFICTGAPEIRSVLEDIRHSLKDGSMIVSLNGSVTFDMIGKVIKCSCAKAIPSVTAEINRSQTLVCFNELVTDTQKQDLTEILDCMGNVIELPESELAMGSELVSCMPGFIASIFDVICRSARAHTSIPDDRIVRMVLNTLCASGELMLEKGISFDEVVSRVATKGGITEEGAKVIYSEFPAVADEMFGKTLERRRQTANKLEEIFQS